MTGEDLKNHKTRHRGKAQCDESVRCRTAREEGVRMGGLKG
jgi:hypothetical protein